MSVGKGREWGHERVERRVEDEGGAVVISWGIGDDGGEWVKGIDGFLVVGGF